MGFKHVFSRRKALSSLSTPEESSLTPVRDENAHLDPPPYSASANNQPDENGAPQMVVPQDTGSRELLDPNLNFSATQMEQQWRAKDKIFARAIVQFIAERFDGNLKSWAGYKYTYIREVRQVCVFLSSMRTC